eukprot:CAMPEP_0202344816 /NCGR_PEP_ID=MMETSP1126-20121109/4329_1 /ASSEMBLY_ACC=CAM_ASM_000457 /TAXON_ID=3047 /ORGANISM="Dunaliella tertiolecta, Strain CCMP1320" /LENGTH=187 /DNA_ID=CAMNT_0048936047 /DNA_START=1531 /DNA_END=2094 /DNA_ORIENTATION=+
MHAGHGGVVVGHLGDALTFPGPQAPVLMQGVYKLELRFLEAAAIWVRAVVDQTRGHKWVALRSQQGDDVHDHEDRPAALVGGRLEDEEVREHKDGDHHVSGAVVDIPEADEQRVLQHHPLDLLFPVHAQQLLHLDDLECVHQGMLGGAFLGAKLVADVVVDLRPVPNRYLGPFECDSCPNSAPFGLI